MRFKGTDSYLTSEGLRSAVDLSHGVLPSEERRVRMRARRVALGSP